MANRDKQKKKESDKRYYLKNIDKIKIKAKEYREKNKEKNNKLQLLWAKNNPEKRKATVDRWRFKNSDYCKEKTKQWNNSEKGKAYMKKYRKENYNKLKSRRQEWVKNNIESQRKKKRDYVRERKKTDLLFKLKATLRNRTQFAFKKLNVKGKKTITMLGANMDVIKKHIEKQFTSGMNWNNHGKGQDKWNIDHIIPLSSAKNEEELINLCHYTNLQPLWQPDNSLKSNKIHPVQIKLLI